jgi:hypothetical protein
MREKEKKLELEKPLWKRIDGDVPESFAGMAAKTPRGKLQVSQPCFMSVSIPAE